MLHKTSAIVLKQTNYGESSLIVHAFTRKFGLQSFLVNGARKPKSKIRSSILQPMSLLDVVAIYRENQTLHRLSEAKPAPVFRTLPYDIRKSTVAIFLNEILYKVLRLQQADEPLFDFVFHSFEWLDSTEYMPANFHLYFLLKLTRFLGFSPAQKKTGDTFFDLKEGVFSRFRPGHVLFVGEPNTSQLSQLMSCAIAELDDLGITAHDRKILLYYIIDFYRLHVDTVSDIKSLAILEDVLH